MLKQWKIVLLTVIFLIFMTFPLHYVNAEEGLKIAFIRDGNVWISDGKVEIQISSMGKTQNPKWSYNGNWLAYLEADQLIVYDVKAKKKFHIYNGDVSKFEWSPIQNMLAFTANKVLNITNVNNLNENRFENVALGVGNFSWNPTGTYFLVSTTASLLPTGWESVKLFTIPKDARINSKKIRHFYTLPKQSDQFFAVGTSGFKWSKDGKWISFIAHPTASLSADRNILCVLSSDGKRFMTVGEMLLNENWVQWSPKGETLAFINGIGRFAVENKYLTLENIPSLKKNILTPKGYVDWDFTWQQSQSLYVSRAKESKWENNETKRPLPALYKINLTKKTQTQITHPQNQYGDYYPIQLNNSLYWIRSNRKKAELWQANQNGKKQKKLITNIDAPSGYYEMYNWDSVISIYQGQ